MRPIGEDEMRAYVEGFRARCEMREHRRRERQARAEAAVARWVERLRAIPEVRRVILYGSLAKGAFDEGSDIDLAVEGLPMEAHFRVACELERDEEFSLDLQRWEELGEEFRELLLLYGRVLYEKL